MITSAASLEFPCQTCEVRDKAICAALDDTELRYLNAIATSVKVDGGQTIFLEGDESTYLFNVVSGGVRLIKLLPDGRRQIVGFLFPGDFLGLSFSGVYAYSAEALSPTTLCRLSRGGLNEVLERFPKLEHEILGLASNELAQAQDHLLILGKKKAIERIVTVLLKLSDQIGEDGKDGVLIELPMNRQDLADYTGLTIESVSRAITQLRKSGILDRPTIYSILIPDITELDRLSGNI